MRALPTRAQDLIRSGEYAVHARVRIEDPNGSVVVVGYDDADRGAWLVSVEYGEDLDQPVSDAVVRLRRSVEDLSLAPLMEDSVLNRDASGAYAPRVDVARRIVIETQVTAPWEEPSDNGWQNVFEGVIDRIEWSGPEITLYCRDLGALLVDRWVEQETTYGDPEGGEPLEDVAQAILDDWAPGVTLYAPDSPGFMVTQYRVGEQSVMDALETLVQKIGWAIRYRYDSGSGTWRLTLYEPDRSATTPQWTFGPDDYLDVTTLEIDRDLIRNVVEVEYLDSVSGKRETVVAEDPVSIMRYGRRWMKIIEADDSPIDTRAEAQAMANAAVADTAWPEAEQQIDTLYFPAAEIGDLYRFTANGVHYDHDHDWAVTSVRHSLALDRQRTTIRTRGKPAGMYRQWFRASSLPPGIVLYAECQARIVSSTATQVTVEVLSVPPYGTVELVSVVGATLASGPEERTPSPSGTRWTFNRPAFQAGEGQAVFRASAFGHQSDDDHIIIPEVGRDTVALVIRASVQQVTPTQITVRVAVADPQPGTGNVTITYSATGGTGFAVSPASPQTIPAGSVTSDLATTGYIDFTITRPVAGSGSGRVTFTATRSGRVADVDAMDVPELPPGQIPPRALIRILEYTDLHDAIVQITGVAGEPTASPPTQYRWREYREGSPPGAYSNWLPLDSNRQATVTVARRPKGYQIVEAQVRTADGLESDPVTVRVAPTDGWQDDETGGPRWSFIVDDDGGQAALMNEAASKGQNLLGPDAGPMESTLTAFIERSVGLEEAGLEVGEIVSAGVEVQHQTPNVMSIEVLFLDSVGSIIASHEGNPITSVTWKRSIVQGLTIPVGTKTVIVRATNLLGGLGQARRFMLNRGPAALPFEAPPLRPNRETLADVSGPLREGTGMLEGQVIHQLFRHGEIITVSGSPYGEMDVPFGQPYEDAPAVSLAGFRCLTFKDDPTFSGDQRLMIQAEVDEDSLKSVAKLVSVSGTVTRQSNDFPLGNALIALGAATEATVTPAGAIGGIYEVHYSVSVTAFPITEAPRNNIIVKVAIETWHGSAWIERAVYTYSAATSSGQRTNTWPHEQKQIVVSDLAAGHKIRLVIKDVTTQGDGGSFTVHGFDGVGDPSPGVTYETAATAERTTSAIPSASDYVKWLVQAIS